MLQIQHNTCLTFCTSLANLCKNVIWAVKKEIEFFIHCYWCSWAGNTGSRGSWNVWEMYQRIWRAVQILPMSVPLHCGPSLQEKWTFKNSLFIIFKLSELQDFFPSTRKLITTQSFTRRMLWICPKFFKGNAIFSTFICLTIRTNRIKMANPLIFTHSVVKNIVHHSKETQRKHQ